MTTVLSLVGVLLGLLVAMTSVFVLGMRAKHPVVVLPIIWLSRVVFNPRQMRTAGKPGAFASIIRHRGRVSGRDLETPVGVVRTDDAFLIALPYGPGVNWVRNVLASGTATIIHAGETHAVDRPEVTPIWSVASSFSAADLRIGRLLRTDVCLRLWPVSQPSGQD